MNAALTRLAERMLDSLEIQAAGETKWCFFAGLGVQQIDFAIFKYRFRDHRGSIVTENRDEAITYFFNWINEEK